MGRKKSRSAAYRVVPPTGLTVWLTMCAALAMAFLATFALALNGAAGRLADRWVADLANSATVRLPAETQPDAVLALLRATPGIARADVIPPVEQAALLGPWVGDGLALTDLPLPVLIAITETSEGVDFAGLRLRLAGDVPDAVLDDHGRWRRPLLAAAERLRSIASVALGLIALATAAMVTLGAQSALAANRPVMSVLRQVGAQDRWIARAFTRRFTLRAGIGAGLGTVAACLALRAWPAQGDGVGPLTNLGFVGTEWIAPLCLPLLCALIARLATHWAAMRVLKGLT